MRRRRRGHPRSCGRRGSILLAVLVVIILGTLIGTTLVSRAGAEQASVEGCLQRLRLRSLALSGIAGVLSEFESQRANLLDGADPVITTEWTLWETAEWRGVVRVTSAADGATAPTSESSRLDVNLATPEMLGALPGMSAEAAKGIIEARSSSPIGSPESLGGIPALHAVLFGEAESNGENPLHYMTTFAFDSNVQIGLSGDTKGHMGEERLRVATRWSEEMEKALDGRMSRAALDALRLVLEEGVPADESALFIALRGAGASPEACGEVLDAVTTSDDLYPRGRVDLNRAPIEVLRCIPGIDDAAADRIVSARGGIDSQRRRNIAWPLIEGLLTDEQFSQAVRWLTTRSLVWRVRIEAVIEPVDDEVKGRAAGGSRMEWDVVVDASAPAARIAYLRDVTYLPAITALAREQAKAKTPQPEAALEAIEAERLSPSPPPDRTVAPSDSSPPSRATRREEVKDISEDPPMVDNDGKDAPTLRDRRIGRWRGRGT